MSELEGAFPPEVLADLAATMEAAAQDVRDEEIANAVTFYTWMKSHVQSLAAKRGIEPSQVFMMLFMGTADEFSAIANACCTYLDGTSDTPVELEDDLIKLALHIGELAHDLLISRGVDPHTGQLKEGN